MDLLSCFILLKRERPDAMHISKLCAHTRQRVLCILLGQKAAFDVAECMRKWSLAFALYYACNAASSGFRCVTVHGLIYEQMPVQLLDDVKSSTHVDDQTIFVFTL